MSAFVEFPKIARLRRNCVVSEKLDGTNAQIFIELLNTPGGVTYGGVCPSSSQVILPNGSREEPKVGWQVGLGAAGTYFIRAGSRNRWITARDDNYGFAKWVGANAEALVRGLGEGTHYGEWWGAGIQRGYGLKEKRFSLFNASRWSDPATRPACCGVVPVLANGVFTTELVEGAVERLRTEGSVAAPGFMKPEGVVVFHVAANTMFKVTLERDESPKGQS